VLPATRSPRLRARRRLSQPARSTLSLSHRNESTLSIVARPIHATPSAIIARPRSVSSSASAASSSPAPVWGKEAHSSVPIHPTSRLSPLASPRAPRTTNDSSATSSRYPAVTPRACASRASSSSVIVVIIGTVANESMPSRDAQSFARRVARARSRAPVLVLVVVIFFAVLNLRHGVARARVRV